ncbi:MAG: hypothetical protein AB1489_09050 [Acidobacteriota bacterium]
MAKRTRVYMVRRGKRYLIERTADGRFGKWVAVGSSSKKSKKTKRGRSASAHQSGD